MKVLLTKVSLIVLGEGGGMGGEPKFLDSLGEETKLGRSMLVSGKEQGS